MSQPHTNRLTFAKGKARVPRWTVGDVIDFEEAEQKTLSSQDAESVLREDGKTLSKDFCRAGFFSDVPRVANCAMPGFHLPEVGIRSSLDRVLIRSSAC